MKNAISKTENNSVQSIAPVTNFIAYYRVSTQKQGISGLGLEAQAIGVNAYITRVNGFLLNEYTEVISGSLNSNKRLQFQKAVNECIKTGATLIVYKLDRLGRNLLNFLTDVLNNRGLNFCIAEKGKQYGPCIGADDKFLLQFDMILGERELDTMRERTKKALEARKAKGKITTNHKLTKEARILGAIAMHEYAKENENNINAYSFVCALYKSGAKNNNEIARIMTEAKVKKPKGTQTAWTSCAVIRLFALYAKTEKSFNIFEVNNKPKNTKELVLHIKECIEVNKMKYNEIAHRLNAIGYKTENSGLWYAQTVKRVYLKTILCENE